MLFIIVFKQNTKRKRSKLPVRDTSTPGIRLRLRETLFHSENYRFSYPIPVQESDGKLQWLKNKKKSNSVASITYVERECEESPGQLAIKLKQKIGRWNIWFMYQSGKANNIIQATKRKHFRLLRSQMAKFQRIDNHHIYYSKDNKTRNLNGVASKV